MWGVERGRGRLRRSRGGGGGGQAADKVCDCCEKPEFGKGVKIEIGVNFVLIWRVILSDAIIVSSLPYNYRDMHVLVVVTDSN